MSSLTANKILDASIALFSEKGYRSVTTKEIAKLAGVSEMTVFRHFETKRNLFEKAFEKYVFTPRFKNIFDGALEWNLEKDLLKISYTYQDTLLENKKIIMMEFKCDTAHDEFNLPTAKFSLELKRMLVEYFTKMKRRGIINGNPEMLAVSFLSANFGFFTSFLVNKNVTGDLDLTACITIFIKAFTKGLTAF